MAVPLSAVAAINPKIQPRIGKLPSCSGSAPDGVAKWQVCRMARAQPQVKGANTASDAEQHAKFRRLLRIARRVSDCNPGLAREVHMLRRLVSLYSSRRAPVLAGLLALAAALWLFGICDPALARDGTIEVDVELVL